VIQQNYETRGKLALIQDQVDGAVEAFRVGEMKEAEEILKAIPGLVDDLIGRVPKVSN
jgi:hypothetical protein